MRSTLVKWIGSSESDQKRIDLLYLPILTWVSRELKTFQKKNFTQETPRPCMVLGVSGSQGIGKTTLSQILVQALRELGKNAVSLSIDDFYLTHHEQTQLAEQYPNQPHLQKRGYPGTHDLILGVQTLHALKTLAVGQAHSCPRYDKSQHQGQGDRRPATEWTLVSGPVDLVILEGWMLGFRSLDSGSPLLAQNPSFVLVNEFLRKYASWWICLDATIQLIPQEIPWVIDWRVEAEEAMKAKGLSGMNRTEISEYIKNFVRAYELYLPGLIQSPWTPEHVLQVVVGKNRLPLRSI